jgi:ferrous iron transport protein B
MGWLEAAFAALGSAVSDLWAPGSTSALRSLLVDGVIGGVGGVLIFLPNIVLLFFCLALMEDTGYMARAAFLMDGLMHRFGLHGRSFIPLMSGFGCSIPGIMATRTLEHEHDRLTTMMVLPLMSCGARLPIWMLLVPAFFPPDWRAPALWGIYIFGVALALVLARLLRQTVLRGEEAPFVMELPPYRLPTTRAVLTRMGQRSWSYMRKAGTVILAISILMWAASAYPRLDTATLAGLDPDQRAVAQLRHSAAGRVGRALEPALSPLGFDWRIATALIGAFAAKEVFVAQMGIVYAMGEADGGPDMLRAALARDYSPLVGVSLILFLLIATPCMATLAVTRRESGSWRWAALQFGGLTAVAYLLSLIVYQVGRLMIS